MSKLFCFSHSKDVRLRLHVPLNLPDGEQNICSVRPPFLNKGHIFCALLENNKLPVRSQLYNMQKQ